MMFNKRVRNMLRISDVANGKTQETFFVWNWMSPGSFPRGRFKRPASNNKTPIAMITSPIRINQRAMVFMSNIGYVITYLVDEFEPG
jgi:hypothetical protein